MRRRQRGCLATLRVELQTLGTKEENMSMLDGYFLQHPRLHTPWSELPNRFSPKQGEHVGRIYRYYSSLMKK